MLGRESVFLAPADVELENDAVVVVERAYGPDWGRVSGAEEDVGQEINECILRKADEDDLLAIDASAPVQEDVDTFKSLAAECGLSMKLAGIDNSLAFDKITFYFIAEGRVDFRELVKRLVKKYSRRVELHQLNLEDQYKFLPSFGICGLEVCCRKMKGLFGMKVAARVCRDQRIAYNPMKMAGCCGKARCCFAFEHDNYAEFAAKLPKLGGKVEFRGREYRLEDWDIFSRSVILSDPAEGSSRRVGWDEFTDAEIAGDSEAAASERVIDAAPAPPQRRDPPAGTPRARHARHVRARGPRRGQ
ncbi:MAG: hypothetical protein HRF49_03745 [bacterium]|jgi:cell fate regulator YaaT (PSP1 superfamily)